MKVFFRKDHAIEVHVHEDFTGSALVIVKDGSYRSALLTVPELFYGDFDLAKTELTEKEARMATSILVEGYVYAVAERAMGLIPSMGDGKPDVGGGVN